MYHRMLWWDYEEYYSVNKQNGKLELNGNAPEEVKESFKLWMKLHPNIPTAIV